MLQRLRFSIPSSVSIVAASFSIAVNCLAEQTKPSELLDHPNGPQTSVAHAQDKLTLNDAHRGTLNIDLALLNFGEEQSEGTVAFYKAARNALCGEISQKKLAEVCREFGRQKIGGPMLGDVTDKRVKVWMHLPDLGTVRVALKPEGDGPELEFRSGAPSEFPAVICDGLSPDQTYSYRVFAEDGSSLGIGRFTTLPATMATPFKIAFGCDFHKIGLHRSELMELIQKRGNRAVLLAGDLAVDDRRSNLGLIRTDYLARDLSPFWQKMAANVPVFATWDDHDYFANDASGASYQNEQIPVDSLRRIWQEQWNNPPSAGEGIYFQSRLGPVQVIMLDTRSCRVVGQQGQLNSFLGERQMKWLIETLSASDAPFIVISGGTMWSDYISGGKDSWGKWDRIGREKIFGCIDAKSDSQVILLSGDRHGARGFAIPRPSGKKIHEFEIGSLGGVPGPNAREGNTRDQLFGYQGQDTWAFGELQFGTANENPQITACLIDEHGVEKETVTIGK